MLDSNVYAQINAGIICGSLATEMGPFYVGYLFCMGAYKHAVVVVIKIGAYFGCQ